MVEQGLPAPFLVAAAVLAYGLAITSLVLIRSAVTRRADRAPAALVVSVSLGLWALAMTGAWALIS